MPRSAKRVVSWIGAAVVALALTSCTGTEDSEPTTVTTTVTPTSPTSPAETSPGTPTTSAPVTNTVTTTQPPADRCDPATFQRSGSEFVDIVLFCDGAWARAGLSQSDYVELFTWSGSAWGLYPADGASPETGYDCYDRGRLVENEAPAYILDNALLCEGQGA